MSLRRRVGSLERFANKQPQLVLEFDTRPSPEQQAAIDEAKQTGRLAFCFLRDASCYILGDGSPPWAAQS